ncbi:MAG TPA: ATP-binding protein [Candidatus Baltobacteraceae bacterium]|nr:ATP-binding protein [Candidatus Baltobacteraceae bacterium]
MIAAVCYVLLLLAWILDLLTPQSFVAAILSNGPIALSALALQSRLTVRLIVLAEIANVVAGVVNGAMAGYHWDTIALGNRAISAATFVLVGVLTIRAQESARRAGEGDERARQTARERALRHAMEHVRASLSLELVLRSAVREAAHLTGAPRVALMVRGSSLDVPDTYEIRKDDDDVSITRAPLSPELASIAERARVEGRCVTIDSGDPLGRMIGENAFVASFDVEEQGAILLIGRGTAPASEHERDIVQAFVDNLAIALRQARLFIRLAEQNAEIGRQRDELQARGDVIRDIVYALAHDLRTPLAAADVTMNQALNGAYGVLPERYSSVLRTTIISNADLRRLVETLLLVARYESGDGAPALVPQPLAPIVARVEAELRPVAEAKGIALCVAMTDEVHVAADSDEMRRAITNLVANAIDATGENGRIDVVVRVAAGRAIIEVLDDGFGVPEERRPALFARFGGVRAGGGTGLGLYIVRRIMEKQGGVSGYEPREPHGSRFFLDLPQWIES